MIDLHIHTIASDGQHTAAEVVEMARALELFAIAVADHNSVESVAEAEAAAREAGIEFAPAVELDTIFRGRDLHLLGYFIAYQSPGWREYNRQIYAAKLEQTRKRVERLKQCGFVIDFDELIAISGRRLPYGLHFMAAMKRHPENFANPEFTAFIDGPRSDSPFLNFYLDWLRTGRPAFVPLEEQPAELVIEKIREHGGVPVLAHPADAPPEDVHALIDCGLMGLEVYSSYHDEARTRAWLEVAGQRKVLVTAGSDFHGLKHKPGIKMAAIPGNRDELFQALQNAAG